MKTCTKCGLVKALDEFHPSKRGAQGRHTYCAACMKTYQQENYCKNKARIKARHAVNHAANKQANNARISRNYYADLTNRRAKARAYAVANRTRMHATKVAWYKTEKGRVAAAKEGMARRLRMSGAYSRPDCPQVEKLRQLAVRLSDTHGLPFHVDHITPIAKGGHDIWENMQVVTAHYNLAKQDRTDAEMINRGY